MLAVPSYFNIFHIPQPLLMSFVHRLKTSRALVKAPRATNGVDFLSRSQSPVLVVKSKLKFMFSTYPRHVPLASTSHLRVSLVYPPETEARFSIQQFQKTEVAEMSS